MSIPEPRLLAALHAVRLGLLMTGAVASNEAPDLAGQCADLFAFFRPSVVLNDGEWRQIDRGDVVVRVLPSQNPGLAIFAASTLHASAEAVATKVGRIAELKKSGLVLGIQRFSDPPALEDLASLTLDDGDLADLRKCRPGDCGLKLAAAEMAALRRAVAISGAGWKSAVHEEFRRLLLERVVAYQTGGLRSLPDDHDHASPVSRSREFAAILAASPDLQEHLPQLAAYLSDYPRVAMTGVESFMYWSTERFGGKPVVLITHVKILRGSGPDVPALIIAGTQVFASHYLTGGLSLTAVVAGPEGAPNYLVYLNRLRVDALGGIAGGLKRAIVERRIRRSTGELITGLRRRLEAPLGVPGAATYRSGIRPASAATTSPLPMPKCWTPANLFVRTWSSPKVRS